MRATEVDDKPARGPDDAAGAPPSERHAHRRDIQGLRAVVVLLVVAFHAGLPVPGGYTGVDVFFVVSGFVITGLLTRELDVRGAIDFRGFYTRRVRRLLPALAVLLAFVCLASLVFLSPLGAQAESSHAAISAAAFIANLHFAGAQQGYFAQTLTASPLLHTWSLSVEEQFYLVFPALLALAWFRRSPSGDTARLRRRAIGIVAAASIASFVLSLTTSNGATFGNLVNYPLQFAFYSSPTRAWEFGAGALVALVVGTSACRLHPIAGLGCGFLGAALIAIAARAITSTTTFPGYAALLPVVGATLVIIGGVSATGGVTRLLSTPPLVWIGDRSYGWYLWHWPFIVFSMLIWPGQSWAPRLAALAALVPTHFSYRFVETPFRFNRSLVGRRALTLAGVCIAVPVVIGLALGVASHAGAKTSNAKLLDRQLAFHADHLRKCDNAATLPNREPPGCTWRPAGASLGTVYLVGDSNAGQFTEPVEQAATHIGYSLTVRTSPGCPFVDVVVRIGDQPIANCSSFVAHTISELAGRHARLVIVASSATKYVNGTTYSISDPHSNAIARTTAAKADLWRMGVTRVLAQLRAANVPAVLVHTIPHFGTWDPANCPAFRIDLDLSVCGTSRTRRAVVAEQLPALNAERAAMLAVPGTRDTDFTPMLCSPTTCATNTGTFFMFRDFAHLTVDGARRFEPAFERLLRSSLSG